MYAGITLYINVGKQAMSLLQQWDPIYKKNLKTNLGKTWDKFRLRKILGRAWDLQKIVEKTYDEFMKNCWFLTTSQLLILTQDTGTKDTQSSCLSVPAWLTVSFLSFIQDNLRNFHQSSLVVVKSLTLYCFRQHTVLVHQVLVSGTGM